MRLAPVIALATSACAVVALNTKARSFPEATGTFEVVGVGAPVQITRDRWGIPHVRAESEADASFALGFLHAQDRLFQADLTRRAAWGTLSEVLGARTVDYDGFVAGLGLRKRAERALAAAPPEVRASLVAYAEGVNAGAATLRADPVEHRLVGATFAPWTPVDGLATVYLNAWQLSENSDVEAFAITLRDRLDRETLDALFRYEAETPPVDLYWDRLRTFDIGDFTAASRLFTGFGVLPRDPEASNNWVVGPSRSADGHAILANDPHLFQRVPSLWYAVDLRGGDLAMAGVTLPGSPTVVIGHNGRVAWGLTNVMGDVADLAVVERVGEWGYTLAGEPRVLTRVPVEVKVRGGDTVRFEALWTEVGPVITERTGTHLVALRWTALELEDETASLFFDLAHADTVDAALAALDHPSVVAQNLVVADTAGAIAWQQFGSLVRRKAFTGRVPYPASEPAHAWQGWLQGLPGERDPARGTVHSANARPDHPLADAISSAYAPSTRHDRIAELLAAQPTFTVDDVAAMQRDRYDGFAAAYLPGALGAVIPSTPGARTCHGLLATWDHQTGPESVGAAVWAVLHRELLREALVDALGEDGFALYLRTVGAGRTLLMGEIGRFQQDPAGETDRALDATCAWLTARWGADPAGWTWGRLHPLALEHPYGSKLASFNLPSTPFGGNGSTVWAASHALGADPMTVRTVASVRIVMPLGDLAHTRLAYPGGQAGQPGHPHYADLFDAYVDGTDVVLHTDDADVAAVAASMLMLVPALSW